MNIYDVFKSSDGGSLFNDRILHFRNAVVNEQFSLSPQNGETLTDRIRSLMNKTTSYSGKIGAHPDFEGIEDEKVYHYIVSVFADIQGSTNLVFKYEDLSIVRKIKNKILTTAIEIFQGFDGHIHRLQGDAIFAYFGGRGTAISDAVIDALNACSILQSYINDYIKVQFEENGIDPVKLRIGIDLGYDDDVLWSKYGIMDCYEITTTSLHTDLAAKLQHACPANSIMIGNNVSKHMDLPAEFLSVKTKVSGGESVSQPYILDRKELKYRMWQFDWKKYTRSFEFFPSDNIFDSITMSCRYSFDESYSKVYASNSMALPKNANLMFSLKGLTDLRKYDVKWTTVNRGTEATEANAIDEFEVEEGHGNICCPQSTAYHGHHYMKCELITNGRVVGTKLFGVYVANDKES